MNLAYQASVRTLDSTYQADVAFIKGEFRDAARQADDIYAQDLLAGTNPVHVDAEKRTRNDAIQEAEHKFVRAVKRHDTLLTEQQLQAWNEKTTEIAAADAWFAAQVPLVYANPTYQAYYALHFSWPPELTQDLKNLGEQLAQKKADADFTYLEKIATSIRAADNKNADAALEKKDTIRDAERTLELKQAEAQEWEEVRKINAIQKKEGAVAQAAKERDVKLAERYRQRVEDLAQLAMDYDIDLEEAAAKRTTDKALAAKAPVVARAADDPTPWWTEQKELVTHSVTYVTGLVAKVVQQFSGDAESERDEISTIAARQETLAKETAELRRARTENDSLSWQTFRLAAASHQRTFLDQEAGLHHNLAGKRATAEWTFDNSSALAKETQSIALAGSQKLLAYDTAHAIAHTNSEAEKNLELAGHTKARALRDATILNTFAQGIITAKETLGLARTTAQQDDYEFPVHVKEKEWNDADTESYRLYDRGVADHALAFATSFAAKYATYLTAVSGKAKETAEEENQSQKTLEDGEAQLDKTRQEDDASSVKDFLSASVGFFQTLIGGWNTAENTPWSRLNASNTQAEVTRANDQGTSLVSHTSAVGGVTLGYLTGLSGIALALGNGIAGALHTENSTLAEAVKQYALGVATKRQGFAHSLADTTAEHDKDVAGRNKVYKDQGTARQKTRDDAVDAAQWDYERDVADRLELFAGVNAGIDYNLAAGSITADQATTQKNQQATSKAIDLAVYEQARKTAVAAAEGARVNGNAADYKNWVSDVGQMNVDFAADAKEAIDGLANDLKVKEDALTTEQASAAKALAAELAGKEKTSQIDSATAGANAGNSLAPLDGTDGINATQRDNAEREARVHNRGTYETELRQEHAAKMQAAVAPAGAMQNLQGFQRSAAIHDVTWSTSKRAAVDAAQSAQSAAYLLQAQGMGGIGGANLVLAAAQGATHVAAVTAQANADQTYSTDATAHLADYSEQSSTAATKALRDGVKAETKYDLQRITAQKEYDDALAQANLVWTGKHVEIEVAKYLDEPIPHVPADYQNPSGTTDATNREGRITAARAAIEAAYQATEKAARAAFAGKVGDGQVTRAGELGDVLVTMANEQGSVHVVHANNSAGDNSAYETAITAKEVSRVTSEETYGITLGSRLAQLQKGLVAALGASKVQLTQALGQGDVVRETGLAMARASFWTGERAATSSRYASWISTQNSADATFLAARATGESQWTTNILPAYVAHATAMMQADTAMDTAIAVATAAQNNAWEELTVAHTASTAPIYAQANIDRRRAERDWIEDESLAGDAHAMAEVTAQNVFDVATFGAFKTQGVTYAGADKTYQAALITSETGGDSAALSQARSVALANADLASATTVGNSDKMWTSAMAAGNKSWRKAQGDVDHAYLVEQARIERDLAIAIAPYDQAYAIAQAAAQTTFWTAETNAVTTHRAAEYLASADFQGADYYESAAAIGGMNAAIASPWMNYAAARAVVERDLFTASGRSEFLAVASALSEADQVYQGAYNVLYTTWALDSAVADKNYTIAVANSTFQAASDESTGDKLYRHAVADADEIWQNVTATIRKDQSIAEAAARRDFVGSGDASAQAAALVAATAAAESARNAGAHGYTVAEATGEGARRLQHASGKVAYATSASDAANVFVQAVSHADKDLRTGEAGAYATRTIAVGQATSSFEIQQSQSLSSAVHAWAITNPSPWANYDDGVLAAVAAHDAVTLGARTTRNAAESLAARDWLFATAGADETRANSRTIAGSNFDVALANLDLQQTIAEIAADVAKAQVVNLKYPRDATPTGGNSTSDKTTTSGTKTLPNTESPAKPPIRPETLDNEHFSPFRDKINARMEEEVDFSSRKDGVTRYKPSPSQSTIRPAQKETPSGFPGLRLGSLADYEFRVRREPGLKGQSYEEWARASLPKGVISDLQKGIRRKLWEDERDNQRFLAAYYRRIGKPGLAEEAERRAKAIDTEIQKNYQHAISQSRFDFAIIRVGADYFFIPRNTPLRLIEAFAKSRGTTLDNVSFFLPSQDFLVQALGTWKDILLIPPSFGTTLSPKIEKWLHDLLLARISAPLEDGSLKFIPAPKPSFYWRITKAEFQTFTKEEIQNRAEWLAMNAGSDLDFILNPDAWVVNRFQDSLNGFGMIPGIGEPFDLLNAAISFYRGKNADGWLNLACALPLLGEVPGAARLSGKLLVPIGRYAVDIGTALRTARTGDKTLGSGFAFNPLAYLGWFRHAPTGQANLGMRQMFLEIAQSPEWQRRAAAGLRFFGYTGDIDWAAFLRKLEQSEYRNAASFLEWISGGWAGKSRTGSAWLLRALGEDGAGHELYHVLDDFLTGVMTRKETFRVWAYAELGAHWFGGPRLGRKLIVGGGMLLGGGGVGSVFLVSNIADIIAIRLGYRDWWPFNDE